MAQNTRKEVKTFDAFRLIQMILCCGSLWLDFLSRDTYPSDEIRIAEQNSPQRESRYHGQGRDALLVSLRPFWGKIRF